jgi:hypothetical protein
LAGQVDIAKVRKAVRGLRSAPREDIDPEELAREVTEVLDANPTTRRMGIRAAAIGNGVVELKGTAQDESERELAANLVRNNTSAPVVINRILVEGIEIPADESVSLVQN